MMGGARIVLDPLLPWLVVAALGAAVAVIAALAIWRRLAGRWWRLGAAAALLLALGNPSLLTETREALADIVLVVTDRSASQTLGDRAAQTDAATAGIVARLQAMGGVEVRQVSVGDAPDNGGSLVMGALASALADEPRGRIAGAIVVTDGQVHDAVPPPDLPAPLQVLLTGQPADWDRRLVVEAAPAFGIIGEEITLRLRVEDQGAAPGPAGGPIELSLAIDGGAPQILPVQAGVPLDLPLRLDHAGANVVSLSVPPVAGELTPRNNAAVVQINGVRDRLRVLLVSGEPHAGERTWRNLLKADAAVDLVHFTILRPPDKQDGVPAEELSLIAFPTRELFVDKIEQFDLIIFDRYSRRGILPASYMENIANYVRKGGAVLVAAGPEFAAADSIFYSALGEIMPGVPTAQVIEEGYTPQISPAGQRHPVTQGLAQAWAALAPPGALQAAGSGATGNGPGADAAQAPGWGRWFRTIEVEPLSGETVMTGAGGRPLLMLDRVGEGRVALLASDHAWLWSRGVEGGGPQQELLRRLAHWMMKEPQLEEEALTLTAEGQVLTALRRTMGEGPRVAEVTLPDGGTQTLPLQELAPGRFSADWVAPGDGLYRVAEGGQSAVIVLGPPAPREYEATIATPDLLAPAAALRQGAVMRLSDGLPEIRAVREGRPAAGRGWIGITPRGASVTTAVTVTPLVPAWLMLVLGAGLMVAAWLREGRRIARPGA